MCDFNCTVSVFARTVLTCTAECAAGVVAALGLVGHLPRSTVEMQVSGDPAGLNGHQVTPDPWTRQNSSRFVIGAEHSALGEVNQETRMQVNMTTYHHSFKL